MAARRISTDRPVKFLDPAAPDLAGIVRPGDHLVWSQACGEPLTLIEALIAQRHALAPLHAFVGASFAPVLRPAHADAIRFTGFGALGATRALVQAGVLDVIPCHVGQIAPYIEQGAIRCDVALVQVSPRGPDGSYGFGLSHDYVREACARARVIVAEINRNVPWTHGDPGLPPEAIHYAIETERPPVEVPAATPGEIDRAIAAHVARYVVDGAVLQIGIGAVPDAVMQLLTDRRDLGLHSGMVGDGLLDLIERGVLTNARKAADRGISVAGALIGSARLYRFAHANPALHLRATANLSAGGRLERIERFTAINSALEVDLTGQVGAEEVGGATIGALGGQGDYVRGAHRAPGGRAIIALPATARGASRIVPRLSGPVTTPRSDVDVIVTEFGAAELRGQPLSERARRLIAIAHPDFREELTRAAHRTGA